VFGQIYADNLWGDAESRSGSGSSRVATEAVRRELPALMTQLGVRILLDAPCGDFAWMSSLVGNLERYVGVDIVADLIARNAARFGGERITFLCGDIAADPLPACDLILCRDCFIHLPTRVIRAALENFKATGARHLLLTNDGAARGYHDIPMGSFRPIDFTRAPFSFPEPVHRVNEDRAGNRQLCLWGLQDLSV
jgi:Methyltransferase domain